MEKEADRISKNALIPEEYWKKINLDAKKLAVEEY